MEQALIYGAYAAAGAVALAVYLALPKEGRPARRGAVVVVSAAALGGLVVLLGQLFGAEGRERLYFYALSVLAVLGSLRVVTHPRPVYSALYFVLVVLSTAGLLVLAGAEFLGAALVIVYAGAILVTYVFVIMMAQQAGPRRVRFLATIDYDRAAREPAAAVLAGFVLVATIAGVIVAHGGSPATPSSVVAVATGDAGSTAAPEGNTLAVAKALFMEDGFPVSLQVGGVLLTIAMVGAIAVALKRLPRAEEDEEATLPGEIGKHVKPF